eukprot:Em0021g411a
MKSIKQSSEPEKKWTAERESIKQSQERNGLLKGNAVIDVIAIVQLHCYNKALSMHRKRSNHSILLFGRSQYEEIPNLSEDEDGKEDVAKATEDGMVLPIILRL